MANKNIVKGDIGNALHSVAPDHIVTTSNEVFDETLQMYQNEVNFLKGVFDISAYNLTDGQPTKYADLTAALGTDGVNVPTQYRAPGMIVRYVQSSDNKYVKFFCTAQNFTTDVTKWQGVDDEPTVGSNNLVKSGGVYYELYNIDECTYTAIASKVHINSETGNLDSLGEKYSNLKVKTFSIEPDSIYYANGRTDGASGYCSIAYYDEEENYIGHELEGGSAVDFHNYKLTIPQNAKYVKVQGNTNPVYEGTPSLQRASNRIDVLSKKMLTKEEQELTEQEINDVLGNLKLKDNNIAIPHTDRLDNKVILLSDGSLSDISGNQFIVDTFEISNTNNVVYYLASGRITNNSSQCSIAYYDENQNYLGYDMQGGVANNFNDYKLTLPEGTKYIKIWSNSRNQYPSLTEVISGEIDDLHREIDSINDDIDNLKYYSLGGKTIAVIGDSISTHGNSGQNPNAVEITVTAEDVGKTLSAYVTKDDVNAGLTLGGTTFTTNDIGTEVTFVPTSEDVGKVIGLPKNYNANTLNVWWTYVRDFFDCNIIPVCWSGSGLTRNRTNSNDFKASYAWHESQIRKCGIRTAGTMNRTAPDVIIITRGGNDWSHSPYAMLTDGYFDNYNIQYPDTDLRQDGEYGFKEAYFMTIGKLREAYPFAKIVLCTYPVLKRINYSHFPMNNGYYSEPQYNNAVREIANFCGCDVIEFDKCGITFENMYPTYISDSATTSVHPNAKGHEVMGKCAIEALKNINFDLL